MKLQAIGTTSFYACARLPSGENDLEQGQAEQSVAGRNKVVGHDTEAVFDMLVEVAGRLRLGDVEIAEECEGSQLPEEGVGRHEQDEPERHDFVPDNAAVVGVADGAAGDVNEPDAAEVCHGQQEKKAKIGKMVVEQGERGPCEQRAEGARRFRGQPAATTQCEKMRRVGEQETDARRLGQSGRIPSDRIRLACHRGRGL